jgi:hypothetical protein
VCVFHCAASKGKELDFPDFWDGDLQLLLVKCRNGVDSGIITSDEADEIYNT